MKYLLVAIVSLAASYAVVEPPPARCANCPQFPCLETSHCVQVSGDRRCACLKLGGQVRGQCVSMD